MKRFIKLTSILLLVSGCASVDRTYSNAVCLEKGAATAECQLARQADAQNSGAKGQNAAVGAVTGCVLTGPFCLLGVGPLIGALVGYGTTN